MTDKEKEDEARRLFEEASVAMKEGNFVQACGQFEAALELLPQHLNTAIKLGQCYDRAGAFAAAFNRFSYAKKLAESQKKTIWVNYLADAIIKIRPRLSWLVVVVPERIGNIPGVVIMRDGTEVDRIDWGMRIPVDVGPHAVWAKAPGRKQWRTEFRVDAEGKAYPITVGDLDTAPQTKPPD